MLDPVSMFALGGLAGMTLTAAVMQIVSLNPARKELDRLRNTVEVWRDAYDVLDEEAAANNREVVSLLAQVASQRSEIAYLRRVDQPRNHGKFAPKLRSVA